MQLNGIPSRNLPDTLKLVFANLLAGVFYFAFCWLIWGWAWGGPAFRLLFAVPLGLFIVATIFWVLFNGFRWLRQQVSAPAYAIAMLLFFSAPVLAVMLSFSSAKQRFLLDFVPDALHVHSIVYEKEQRWGLPLIGMPGDLETGIRVYRLPDSVAQEIGQQGIAWLQNMPPNKDKDSSRRHWYGNYTEWHETPLEDEVRRRMTRVRIGPHHETGPSIEIAPQIWADVQEIVSSRGNYYALGRTGVIVVSPSRKRVVYMFNG